MQLLNRLGNLRFRRANKQLGKWNALAAEKETISREINGKLRDIQAVRDGWKAAGMTKEEANAKMKGLGMEIDRLRAKNH